MNGTLNERILEAMKQAREQYELEQMEEDVAQGPLAIEEFEARPLDGGRWPSPFTAPRTFRIDPPLTIYFRLLTTVPDDESDAMKDAWALPCIIGDLDEGGTPKWGGDFPVGLEYDERTGGSREEVVAKILEHIAFHYQICESEAFYGGATGEDVEVSRRDMETYWSRVHVGRDVG